METDDLKALARVYAEIERDVQAVSNPVCAPYCSECMSVCCRPDFCFETVSSAWLVFVRETIAPDAECVRCGNWLSETGCRLPAGRPPVCYEFYCNAILDSIDDPFTRYALRAAGQCMNVFGRRAVGETHLVELEDLSPLTPTRIERLLRRRDTVTACLASVRAILSGKAPGKEDLHNLKTVCRPPAECAL